MFTLMLSVPSGTATDPNPKELIMKASNIVISIAAAISMAGALGLVYAQSTYSDPQTGSPGTTSQQGATGPSSQDSGTMSQDSSTMSQDATDTTGSTQSDSMSGQRLARADRN
jgi:hypothetical protein